MQKNIYSVGQLNSYIRNMFSQDFLLHSVYVQGEISNLKYHSSGHIYFTLKDEKGCIACIMFAGNRTAGLRFRLEEGMQIIVGGTVDVYERDGKYQLYARTIQASGNGQLAERFELLKQRLSEMGMFSEEYKQPIPGFVRTLGVVTAPTGAAIRDIIQIATRRNPYVQIVLYPAIVQGDMAAASIVKGIRALEEYGVDVMIVGRGGGSMEDLWAFNEEIVAEAVFNCRVPIISAVGHETDTTICDYVADLRAPTPSAAAELAVLDMHAFDARLLETEERIRRHMVRHVRERRNELERRKLLLERLSPAGRIHEKKMNLIRLEEELGRAMQGKIDGRRHQLSLLIQWIKGLSPLDKLNQGYCFVSDGNGRPLSDVKRMQAGDVVTISMKNGEAEAEILRTKTMRRENHEERE